MLEKKLRKGEKTSQKEKYHNSCFEMLRRFNRGDQRPLIHELYKLLLPILIDKNKLPLQSELDYLELEKERSQFINVAVWMISYMTSNEYLFINDFLHFTKRNFNSKFPEDTTQGRILGDFLSKVHAIFFPLAYKYKIIKGNNADYIWEDDNYCRIFDFDLDKPLAQLHSISNDDVTSYPNFGYQVLAVSTHLVTCPIILETSDSKPTEITVKYHKLSPDQEQVKKVLCKIFDINISSTGDSYHWLPS
jgi:hypothetical protein